MFNSTVSPSPQKKSHPKFFDLGHPFEKILHSWGSSRIQRMLTPRETTYAPLERMTPLDRDLERNPGGAELAGIRGPQLRNLRADSSLGRYNETEVFEEMISLYSLYLFMIFGFPHDFQVVPHPSFSFRPRGTGPRVSLTPFLII